MTAQGLAFSPHQMSGRKLHLTDIQRRRLAAKAKLLGRRALNQVATIVTPGTLMRWHITATRGRREGVLQRCDGILETHSLSS